MPVPYQPNGTYRERKVRGFDDDEVPPAPPVPVGPQRHNRRKLKDTVACVDPGVRVPDTVYFAGNKRLDRQSRPAILEIGEGAAEFFEMLAAKRAKLGRLLTAANASAQQRAVERGVDKPSKRSLRACARLRRRMHNVAISLESFKHDLMVRRASAMFSRAETVLFPLFRTGDMVRSKCLHPSTKKRMLSLGHCRFRHFLRHRAMVLGKTLRVVTEHYTSQACPLCLRRNKKLGSSKVFRCPFCLYR